MMFAFGMDVLSLAINNLDAEHRGMTPSARIKSSLKAFRRNFQARSPFRLFEFYQNPAVNAFGGGFA